MLRCCPCLGWCLTDPSSGGEAKVLLNPITPTYNVRRISSFGQTVINEVGEEEEVARHGTLPATDNNGFPPWTTNAIPIQPGVTNAEITARMHRLASIPEATPKSRHRLNKSLSCTEPIHSDMSPIRTRKKVPTPEEFAQVNYYHDRDADAKSISSEVSRKEEEKSEDIPDYMVDEINLNEVVDEDESKRRFEKSGDQINSVKALKNPNVSDKPKSPWVKVRNTIEDKKSPFMKMKTVMDKPYSSHLDLEYRDVSAEREDVSSEHEIKIKALPPYYDYDDSESISQTPSQDTTLAGDDDVYEVILEGNKSFGSADIAKQYGLDLNMYNTSSSVGLGNSEDDLSANIFIAKIVFKTQLDTTNNKLQVNIEKVEGLGGQGPKNEEFEVVIKIGFLKGGHSYSTKPFKSCNPINQSFTLNVKDLTISILRLTVYNSAWQGPHDALGHALFRISNCSQTPTHQCLKVSPKSNISDSIGLLEVSFHIRSNILHVIVHKVFDILPVCRSHKIYIKVSKYLASKKAKEKISKTENADKGYTMFDFESKFKSDDLMDQHAFIMISLKKKGENNKFFKNDKTLGRILLGPLFYTGNNINYWGEAILEKKIITRTFSLYL